jgi:hypothetical protein
MWYHSEANCPEDTAEIIRQWPEAAEITSFRTIRDGLDRNLVKLPDIIDEVERTTYIPNLNV